MRQNYIKLSLEIRVFMKIKYFNNFFIEALFILLKLPTEPLPLSRMQRKSIHSYLWPYRWKMLWGVVFIIISKIYSVYPAQYIRESIDFIDLEMNNDHLQKDLFYHQILIYISWVVGAALLNGLFLFFTRQTIIVVSRCIEYDQKNEIYDQYQRLGFNFYKKHKTGDLMSRISEDVSRVRMYFGPALMYSINLFFLFIMVIATMLQVNATLTLYCLLPLPILALIIYYVSKRLQEKGRKTQERLADLTSITQESFAGIRIIKSFDRKLYFMQLFNQKSESYKESNMSLTKTDAFFQPAMTLLIGLSTIFTVYMGSKLHIQGEITKGNIAEFVIYVNMLTWPVASMGWVASLTQRALASYKRIRALLDEPVAYQDVKDAKTFENGDIKLEGVSYNYEKASNVALKNISIELPKGKTLGVIGKTGSGKSTLAYLLCRMIEPSEGKIYCNGNELKDYSLRSYREILGYVPQDVFLFSDTIAQNIAFSKKITPQDMILSAKRAQVHQEIMALPDQYNAVLGERGINLSGGQKQRISMARAFVKNPQILIMDDCFSAVDLNTEHLILSDLQQNKGGKTRVIISQRTSAIKMADEIIYLEQGQIIEKGTHQDLLELKGKYFQLYIQQNNPADRA